MGWRGSLLRVSVLEFCLFTASLWWLLDVDVLYTVIHVDDEMSYTKSLNNLCALHYAIWLLAPYFKLTLVSSFAFILI